MGPQHVTIVYTDPRYPTQQDKANLMSQEARKHGVHYPPHVSDVQREADIHNPPGAPVDPRYFTQQDKKDIMSQEAREHGGHVSDHARGVQSAADTYNP